MRVELTDDLDTCRALRRAVFIDEQGVTEAEEWDGRDGDAIHLLARDATGAAAGTARIAGRKRETRQRQNSASLGEE